MYCRAVEAHLTQVNGGHLVRIVGPSFDLVRRWAAEDVPLAVVKRGIDRKAERHDRGVAARPLRLEFCEADVRDIFDGWRRAVGLPRAGDPPVEGASAEAAEPRRRSLTRHLDRAIERLTAAAGRMDLPESFRAAAGPMLGELAALRDAAKKARGPARDEITGRLPALDVSLLLLMEPVLNPVWTWAVRGESPGGWTIAGGAVIVGATAAKVLTDARRDR